MTGDIGCGGFTFNAGAGGQDHFLTSRLYPCHKSLIRMSSGPILSMGDKPLEEYGTVLCRRLIFRWQPCPTVFRPHRSAAGLRDGWLQMTHSSSSLSAKQMEQRRRLFFTSPRLFASCSASFFGALNIHGQTLGSFFPDTRELLEKQSIRFRTDLG